MVNELAPLFAVMILTLVVMAGLLVIFKRWMRRRDKLIENQH
jgi:hypothetical protein